MDKPTTVTDAVEQRRAELLAQRGEIETELARLETYLAVLAEFNSQMRRKVVGGEIDQLCVQALREAGRALKPSELVEVLTTKHHAEFETDAPARLISTRMSNCPLVESTGEGWQLKKLDAMASDLVPKPSADLTFLATRAKHAALEFDKRLAGSAPPPDAQFRRKVSRPKVRLPTKR